MGKFIKGILLTFNLLVVMSVHAQFTLHQDTVCVNQDVQFTSTLTNAQSHYWGTNSAWIKRAPNGQVIASGTPLNGPSFVSLQKDASNYYLFASNYSPNFELIRYDFGSQLGSIPSSTNLGDFGGLLPPRITGMDFFYENNVWTAFAIGGIGVNSSLARLDFGSSLANTPVVTNLGDLGGLIVSPQDIHVFKEGSNYHAYYFNGLSSSMVRLDFGPSLSNNPVLIDLGNPGTLNFPTDMEVVKQNNTYYGFVINRLSNTLTRLEFGTSMLNAPIVTDITAVTGLLNNPRYMSIVKDDGNYLGLITNEATNVLTTLDFNTNITNVPSVNITPNFAGFNGPRGITKFYRQRDNIYGFVSNFNNSSISQVRFDSTNNATLLTDTNRSTRTFKYTTPGVYNVLYQAVDQDSMPIEEQFRITVLALPRLDFHNDTTICQGDTIFMVVNGSRLSKIKWSPNYNLLYSDDTTSVYIHPDEDIDYQIHLEFEYGCALDTSIYIQVSKVKADAGPDRIVGDGATTELGGPGTTLGQGFIYNWTPNLYLNDNDIPNPIARVTDSLQYYYLEVRNANGCIDRDTVSVTAFCGSINCPNAFDPMSNEISNRSFGIANYQLNKLDYFRIYDRWGKLLFETTDPFKKWDGNFNYVPQPMDTYIWEASGICDNGRKVRKVGNVLLIR